MSKDEYVYLTKVLADCNIMLRKIEGKNAIESEYYLKGTINCLYDILDRYSRKEFMDDVNRYERYKEI